MKPIFTLLLTLITFVSVAQTLTETKDLAYGRVGIDMEWGYKQIIENGSDTLTYAYLSFQNYKYKTIFDRAYIYFNNKVQLDEFIASVELILTTDQDKEVSVTFSKGRLSNYAGMYKVFIYNTDDKYCYLSRKNLGKLATALKSKRKYLR